MNAKRSIICTTNYFIFVFFDNFFTNFKVKKSFYFPRPNIIFKY